MMEGRWWKYKEWHQRIVLRWSQINFYCGLVVFVLFHSCICTIWQLYLFCISVVLVLCGSCISQCNAECHLYGLSAVLADIFQDGRDSGRHLPRWSDSGIWERGGFILRTEQVSFSRKAEINIFLVLGPQWDTQWPLTHVEYWLGKYDWHHSWTSFVRTTVISDQHNGFLKMPQLSPRYGLPVWPPI